MDWSEEELRRELNRYETELREAGKSRNTVTSYVQPVERFLNWLLGRYAPKRAAVGSGARRPQEINEPPHRGVSRYDALREYLSERSEPVIRLSFEKIEQIIDGALPPSARRYRAWWGNERSGTHVHARSWLNAGRRTANVDMSAGTVEFVK